MVTKPPGGSPGPDAGSLGRLARGTLVYGLGTVLNRVVTFLLLPVLTRFLSPGEYGISAILDVLCAFLVAVFSLGFGSSLAICYFDSTERSYREKTVSTAFMLLAASSAVLALGMYGGAGWFGRLILGSTDHARLIMLSVGTTAMMILPIPFGLRLQYEERAVRVIILNLVSTVLIVALSLTGVVVLGRGVSGLWEGRFAAHALTCLLFAAHFPWSRILRFCRKTALELFRLGLPMIPAFASLFVLLQGNRYILSLFADMDTVGVYSVGVQLGMVMGLAVSAFTTAWTPYFMALKDRGEAAGRTFSRVATYYVLGFGGLSLMFYAAARPVILVMTGPAFHMAYIVTGYAATTQFMIGLYNVLLPQCTFAREIKYSSLVQCAAAVLAVAFNLILIPPFGMVGAGIALALGTATMALLLHAWNRFRGDRYLAVPYEYRRITLFAIFYLALAAVTVYRRQWPLGLEMAVAAAGTGAIILVVWMMLDSGEKRSVFRSLGGLAGNLRGFLHG